MGHSVEEAPEGVGSLFSPGVGDKLYPSPSGRSGLDLTFYAAYTSIDPILMISIFCRILLLNLVGDRMGPVTTSFYILSSSELSLLFHSPPPSAVRSRAPLLSALLSHRVKSRSRSRWDSHFPFYILRIYLGLYLS